MAISFKTIGKCQKVLLYIQEFTILSVLMRLDNAIESMFPTWKILQLLSALFSKHFLSLLQIAPMKENSFCSSSSSDLESEYDSDSSSMSDDNLPAQIQQYMFGPRQAVVDRPTYQLRYSSICLGLDKQLLIGQMKKKIWMPKRIMTTIWEIWIGKPEPRFLSVKY